MPNSSQRLSETAADSIKTVTAGMDGMEEAIAQGGKTAKAMVDSLDTAGAKAQQKVASVVENTGAQIERAAATVDAKLKSASEAPAMLAESMLVLQQDCMNLLIKSLSRAASLSSDIRNSRSIPHLLDAQRAFISAGIEDLTALNVSFLNRSVQFWPIYKGGLGA